MHTATRRNRTTIPLAACVLLLLGGCWFGSARSGAVIEHDGAARIAPGKTAKQQVLEWFGPPLALLRRGAMVTVPRSGVRPVGWREVQADTYFELFSTRQPPAADDLIYYYASAEQTESGVFLLVAGTSSTEVHESQLWILIDGATGVVKDFVFRKGGQRPPEPADEEH